MSEAVVTRPAPVPPATPAVATVDIVLPVLDEATDLERSVRRLHAYLTDGFALTWRITVVDNASTDATPAIAAALAAELDGVDWIRLEERGRGRALRAAWSRSESPVLAYMDVDLSTDLDALLPMVAPLASGHSDLAIGSRLAPGASVARRPKRELISRSYNLLMRTVFATTVRDLQCGFKALRRDVARDLLPAVRDEHWFFDSELLLLAERNGLRIHQVPVDWVDDPDSRVRIARTAVDDLRGALRMAVTFLRGGGEVGLTHPRPVVTDDCGRRLVTFSAIGAASTAVSVALFLLLRAPLGPVGANAVAVTTTFVANTWLHARFTARTARPRWWRSLDVYVGALALTSAVLAAVGALDVGLVAELVALAVTWAAAGVTRFALLDQTPPREPQP
jgi:putative flippase GtrA